jgi:NAD(P)-dependent dehydrogenase (short-subunit alcohol dehydrogenase family)
MAGDLTGKNAFVTGAGRGIGRASALLLAEHGAVVAVVDHDANDAGETLDHIQRSGGTGATWLVDVADLDALGAAVQSAIQQLGAIDILVNARSLTGENESLREPREGNWEAVHAVNVTAPRFLIGVVGAHMAQRGRGGKIVSISSSSGSRATTSRPAYGVSKAALNALTRVAAAELGQYDINVNAVAPGITATPLQRGLRDDGAMQSAVSSGPLENFFHRVSAPEDVAATVVFLCLPASRQITGQVIHTSAGVVV